MNRAASAALKGWERWCMAPGVYRGGVVPGCTLLLLLLLLCLYHLPLLRENDG
jgi:hypothetical protein